MPWKEKSIMSERIRFVTRLEDGESMASLCREYGISRKTGYKFWNRYLEDGPSGLEDQRRRPYSNPKCTSQGVLNNILALKKERPHWGAKKIKELFLRRYPDIKTPSISTIHRVLEQNNLVNVHKKRFRGKASPTDLNLSLAPNDLWCIDFKGQFRMGDRKYCYPLTITDHWTRYLIGCEGLENIKAGGVFQVFDEIFNTYGLPERIRSDNGAPFASVGPLGLTKLSVWFLRLGIKLERIEPGHPEQNGRHERMHLTLKQETTNPAESNILTQQNKFDQFKKDYNDVRPHEALNMKTPGELYKRSKNMMPTKLEDAQYPNCEMDFRVNKSGKILWTIGKKEYIKINIGNAFIGEKVGLKLLEDGLWLVKFLDYDLGYYDEAERMFTRI